MRNDLINSEVISSRFNGVHEGEILPEVSFDIDLGKKYSHVDFDYVAFRNQIRNMGGDNSDYQQANIRFEDRGLSPTRGYYSPSTQEIVVATSEKTNDVLAHETRHYLDGRDGLLDRRRAIAANLSSHASTIATIALLGTLVMSIMPESSLVGQFGDAWIDEVRIAQFAAAVASFYLYYLSPAEIRARESSRIHARSIVTLEK